MFASNKPYTAITVAIEKFTSNEFEVDDISAIPNLVDIIQIPSTGSSEASRAVRKKLKYGNVHQQLRALTIMDALIQNGGKQIERDFVDEMLLERLRLCATSDISDPKVKDKCEELFRSWAAQYTKTRGLTQLAKLHKQLPQRKQAITQEKSKVIKETENPFDAEEDKEDTQSPRANNSPTAGPSHGRSSSISTPSFFSSKKDKKDKDKKSDKKKGFSFDKEKGTMQTSIAQSTIASINLMNTLRSINREKERVSQNPTAVKHLDECKVLRRKIYRYVIYMTDMSDRKTAEEWVGGLIDANDKLVEALLTFENLDKSIDADSDSDDELAAQAHLYKMSAGKGKENEPAQQLDLLQGLQISPTKAENPPQQPPRPIAPVVQEVDEHEEDENDPFGDNNAIEDTPTVEKGEPDWGMGTRR